MREIKFRAWDGKKMLQGQSVMNLSLATLLTWSDKVMQFTGLKDKNGKEIYEGDLIQDLPDGYEPRLIDEVVWWEEKLAWAVKDKFGGYGMLWPEKEFKVIGNIYENPELIK